MTTSSADLRVSRSNLPYERAARGDRAAQGFRRLAQVLDSDIADNERGYDFRALIHHPTLGSPFIVRAAFAEKAAEAFEARATEKNPNKGLSQDARQAWTDVSQLGEQLHQRFKQQRPVYLTEKAGAGERILQNIEAISGSLREGNLGQLAKQGPQLKRMHEKLASDELYFELRGAVRDALKKAWIPERPRDFWGE